MTQSLCNMIWMNASCILSLKQPIFSRLSKLGSNNLLRGQKVSPVAWINCARDSHLHWCYRSFCHIMQTYSGGRCSVWSSWTVSRRIPLLILGLMATVVDGRRLIWEHLNIPLSFQSSIECLQRRKVGFGRNGMLLDIFHFCTCLRGHLWIFYRSL